eukprot:CAMPEP_0117591592 /NCGR_PEP_ID=MMETSP0784-20121206/71618_1 /TAXON_ID=39447 /ORGANISM="" /LENGTH=51 /DNA_ID=CAMNT_0005393331 /DNA_START=96 /DNA_END=248 /DNA_ORIENTATION=-
MSSCQFTSPSVYCDRAIVAHLRPVERDPNANAKKARYFNTDEIALPGAGNL